MRVGTGKESYGLILNIVGLNKLAADAAGQITTKAPASCTAPAQFVLSGPTEQLTNRW